MKITSAKVRSYRKWHKWIGLSLGFFLMISALSGLLLGLKKQAHILQPTEISHNQIQLQNYRTIAEMVDIANAYWLSNKPGQPNVIKRIDIKADKGIVKLLFEKGYWELQMNPVSGEVLSLAKRNSDWIEAIHDGSIITENFKVVAMFILGLGLMVMIISGFYLWYGPKNIRSKKDLKQHALKL